ncbi:MAG TPA: GNAT family N-acetyltransferase [Humibacter sp.]|nr:GNAT family N-acetyltransferase [Humibacter sp.]
MRVEIRPVQVPDEIRSADDADAADFADFVDVGNACAVQLWGNDDFVYSAIDELPSYRPSPFHLRMIELARLDGLAVGCVSVVLPLEPDATTAELDVRVVPGARGRGIGSALLARGEELIAEGGRLHLTMYSEHVAGVPEDGIPTVSAPTGAVALRADDPAVRFARAHGYRLGQVDVMSALAVPLPPSLAERLERETWGHATGYRTVSWWRHCPDELVDGYAQARAQMVHDVPREGITLDAEQWDIRRVRDYEERLYARAEPLLTTAALDEAIGEFAAYTEIAVPTQTRTARCERSTTRSAQRRWAMRRTGRSRSQPPEPAIRPAPPMRRRPRR